MTEPPPDTEPEHEWRAGDHVTVLTLTDPTTGRTVGYLIAPVDDDTGAPA